MVEKGEIENDNKIPFLIHLIGKNLKAQYQMLARIQRNRNFEILLERVYILKQPFWQDLVKLKMYVPRNPETLLLGIHPKETLILLPNKFKDVCC